MDDLLFDIWRGDEDLHSLNVEWFTSEMNYFFTFIELAWTLLFLRFLECFINLFIPYPTVLCVEYFILWLASSILCSNDQNWHVVTLMDKVVWYDILFHACFKYSELLRSIFAWFLGDVNWMDRWMHDFNEVGWIFYCYIHLSYVWKFSEMSILQGKLAKFLQNFSPLFALIKERHGVCSWIKNNLHPTQKT